MADHTYIYEDSLVIQDYHKAECVILELVWGRALNGVRL